MRSSGMKRSLGLLPRSRARPAKPSTVGPSMNWISLRPFFNSIRIGFSQEIGSPDTVAKSFAGVPCFKDEFLHMPSKNQTARLDEAGGADDEVPSAPIRRSY